MKNCKDDELKKKISKKDLVSYKITWKGMEVSIKYNKRTRLKQRLELIEKIRKDLYLI
ncbi:hypothetical protein LCGC14_0477840 [marine sediment metagenome]|uniref:Uncharacterized protein n=1 Tax=marine sediment metagenome TaxID=412755 RepID=A0A0F9VJ50_9ZZZZ